MFKKQRWLLLCLIYISAVHGQGKIERLQNQLIASKGTHRVDLLNELTFEYLKNTNNGLTLAEQYNREALSTAKALSYHSGTGRALVNSGSIILELNRRDKQKEALKKFQEALQYFRSVNNKRDIVNCMKHIAGSLHHLGELKDAIRYTDSAKNIYLQLKDTANFISRLAFKGHCYFDLGDYKTAYKLGIEALRYAEKTNDTLLQVTTLVHLSNLFLGAGLPEASLSYFRRITQLYPAALQQRPSLPPDVVWGLIIAGESFLKLNLSDSAENIAQKIPPDNTDTDYNLFLAHLHASRHDYLKALQYLKAGFELDLIKGPEIGISRYANEIGKTYLLLNQIDSAKHYTQIALGIAERMHALLEMRNAVETLTNIYVAVKNYEQVYRYSQRYKTLNDSLAPEEYKQKLALVQIQNELENQKQKALVLSQQNKIKEQQLSRESLMKKFLYAGIFFLLLFGVFVLHNNRQKQKANMQLQEQKEEVQKALSELKATQSQLIQREKMASLGELTAGVAHEIQNPLNFVNNFSEVNTELLQEMKKELATGNTHEAIAIADDLEQNLHKINHHGKRADAIVKSMLQHSKARTGEKEATDINALVDECLRLSYHGLRAKDKTFNARLETHLDPSLNKINIVPQDITRVLVNLFNNALYSVAEKKKQLNGNLPSAQGAPPAGQAGYEPGVSVSTKQENGSVEIIVRDNGTGIPAKAVDKIFQPFFTTKPTGEGTGLGLSLSYDIIKAHGGEMRVETKEGEGAEFIVHLPIV